MSNIKLEKLESRNKLSLSYLSQLFINGCNDTAEILNARISAGVFSSSRTLVWL